MNTFTLARIRTRSPINGGVAATLFLSFSVALASANACFAQQGSVERTLPLVVMTRDGKIISDVSPQNISLKGVKATVKRIAFDDSPRKVVLVLDISGSMTGGEELEQRNGRWNNARAMAEKLLANLPPADWISLHVFADHDREVVAPTHDFDSIRKAIDLLPDPDSKPAVRAYGGTTQLGEALSAILNDRGRLQSFGDSIVVFSDGGFNGSGADGGRVRAQLLARGIRIFLAIASARLLLPPTLAIGLPATSMTWRWYPPPEGALAFYYAPLQDAASLCKLTAGTAIQAEPLNRVDERFKPDSLEAAMKQAAWVVQDTYRLQLSLGEALTKQRKIKLELVGSSGKPVRVPTLLYPEYLKPTPKDQP